MWRGSGVRVLYRCYPCVVALTRCRRHSTLSTPCPVRFPRPPCHSVPMRGRDPSPLPPPPPFFCSTTSVRVAIASLPSSGTPTPPPHPPLLLPLGALTPADGSGGCASHQRAARGAAQRQLLPHSQRGSSDGAAVRLRDRRRAAEHRDGPPGGAGGAGRVDGRRRDHPRPVHGKPGERPGAGDPRAGPQRHEPQVFEGRLSGEVQDGRAPLICGFD